METARTSSFLKYGLFSCKKLPDISARQLLVNLF